MLLHLCILSANLSPYTNSKLLKIYLRNWSGIFITLARELKIYVKSDPWNCFHLPILWKHCLLNEELQNNEHQKKKNSRDSTLLCNTYHLNTQLQITFHQLCHRKTSLKPPSLYSTLWNITRNFYLLYKKANHSIISYSIQYLSVWKQPPESPEYTLRTSRHLSAKV